MAIDYSTCRKFIVTSTNASCDLQANTIMTTSC